MTDKDSPIRQNDWLKTRIFLHVHEYLFEKGNNSISSFWYCNIGHNAAMPEQLNIKYFGIFVIKRF